MLTVTRVGALTEATDIAGFLLRRGGRWEGGQEFGTCDWSGHRDSSGSPRTNTVDRCHSETVRSVHDEAGVTG